MKMDIGISWGCYGGLSVKEQAELMAENGFKSTFIGGDDPKMGEILPVLERYGISCENVHAPFSRINDMWRDGEDGERMLAELLDTVDRCKLYGIPVMVAHLSSGNPVPRITDVGYFRFERLMEHAEAVGVSVAYENQRFLANLAYMMEQFPTARFCWDVGHEACFTDGRCYMPLFGEKLSALHVHDNDMMYNSDLHLIPYDGKIDFDRVAGEIAQSGYIGSLMLELSRGNSRYYDGCSPEDYYRRAAQAAVRLRNAVEKEIKGV
jgi:sugar phosphate isomerase/epimerase